MAAFVALLRGINVGGNKKVPMADLRALCTSLGWAQVETYIQSGNVFFEAKGSAAALESALELAIPKKFGFDVPVLVRPRATFVKFIEACSLKADAEKEPHLLHLVLTKKPLAKGCVEALQAAAKGDERVAACEGALWIHYSTGVARSKLTPALIDRVAGSTMTARNWKTTRILAGLEA